MAGYGKACPSIHSGWCSGQGGHGGKKKNTKVSERSLFIAVSVWAVCFVSAYVSISFPRTCTHEGAPAFSEATVRMHVNIVRLACNYHSKVKRGLIHRGESRADQRDLGEDRTKNVKSRSLWNTEMSICLRTPWCSLRRTWSKPVLQRWSQKMIWPRLHLSAVSLFTFLPVSIYLAWAPRHCPVFRLPCVCAAG